MAEKHSGHFLGVENVLEMEGECVSGIHDADLIVPYPASRGVRYRTLIAQEHSTLKGRIVTYEMQPRTVIQEQLPGWGVTAHLESAGGIYRLVEWVDAAEPETGRRGKADMIEAQRRLSPPRYIKPTGRTPVK